MKILSISLAFLSCGVLLFGILHKEEKIQNNFDIKAGEKIELSNINGSVIITGWDKQQVEMIAVKRTLKKEDELKKVEIKVTEKDGLKIETIHLKKKPKVSVSYELKVPQNVELKFIRSSNGSIKIEKVGIVHKLVTSNGSIKLFNSKGEVEAQTSNGSIQVDGLEGSVTAQSSNGSIDIRNVDGYGEASTSNASIKMFNIGTILGIHTSNGTIKAELNKLMNDLDVTSSNGSITLYLGTSLDADIEASTSNSSINIKNDVNLNTNQLSRSRLSGSIGNGGHQIYSHTSNGSITFNSSEGLSF